MADESPSMTPLPSTRVDLSTDDTAVAHAVPEGASSPSAPGVSRVIASMRGPRADAGPTRNTVASHAAVATMAERQDLAHIAAFYRQARLPAIAAWLVWVPFDCALTMMYPGTFWRSMAIRAVSTVMILVALEGLVRAKSYRAMTAWMLGLAVTINLAIAAVATHNGGVHSPYNVGSVVMIAVLGYSPLPWRRVLPIALATWAVYPAVVLGYALYDPVQHEALHATNALVPLGTASVVGLIVVAMACIGAGLSWALRQQVFESRSIGRYQLRRRLGAGGMGEVWAAWHKGLQREVALKILRASGDDVQAAAQRFEREVRAMTELTHPNTVRVFDFGTTDDGITYYAMELLDGENLVELVSREGPLAPERVVYLASQAARALAEAHKRGLVHRDVKPENLFVTNAGGERDFLKVLDFGIVRREAEAEPDHLTKTGSIAGTPAYIAPEVVRGEAATARADVYALGGVMYFLLTGRHAIAGRNVVEQLLAQLHDEVVAPSCVLGRPIAADVEALVMRCLSKEPPARPADAAALAEALARSSLAGAWRPALATSITSKSSNPNALAVAVTVEATRP